MKSFNLQYLKPTAFITVCVILAIALTATNKYVSTHWGISLSVVAMITGLFTFINRYLWNRKPFSWMYEVIDFSGTYKGSLTYRYRNENSELISHKLEHIKVIHQNGSNIIVKSWTKKSDGSMSTASESKKASIIKEDDGTFSLIYNYLNEGSQGQEFPPHYGTEVLKIAENKDGKYLAGKYYTERLPFQTKGEIKLEYMGEN